MYNTLYIACRLEVVVQSLLSCLINAWYIVPIHNESVKVGGYLNKQASGLASNRRYSMPPLYFDNQNAALFLTLGLSRNSGTSKSSSPITKLLCLLHVLPLIQPCPILLSDTVSITYTILLVSPNHTMQVLLKGYMPYYVLGLITDYPQPIKWVLLQYSRLFVTSSNRPRPKTQLVDFLQPRRTQYLLPSIISPSVTAYVSSTPFSIRHQAAKCYPRSPPAAIRQPLRIQSPYDTSAPRVKLPPQLRSNTVYRSKKRSLPQKYETQDKSRRKIPQPASSSRPAARRGQSSIKEDVIHQFKNEADTKQGRRLGREYERVEQQRDTIHNTVQEQDDERRQQGQLQQQQQEAQERARRQQYLAVFDKGFFIQYIQLILKKKKITPHSAKALQASIAIISSALSPPQPATTFAYTPQLASNISPAPAATFSPFASRLPTRRRKVSQPVQALAAEVLSWSKGQPLQKAA